MTDITTVELLNALPVGSVVLAHWEDGSQPDHQVVRSGRSEGGATASGWTLANERQWDAIVSWGAVLTVLHRPDAVPADPATAEQAWDEGYQAGRRDGAETEQRMQMRDWWGEMPTTPNPYGTEADDE